MLAEAFKKTRPNSEIKILSAIGSGGAVRGVASGRVDIGLVARPLKLREKKLGLSEFHYANTALVYVVKDDAKINNVDVSLLTDIYRGQSKTTNLTIILRPRTDSDTLLLQNKLPEITPALMAAFSRKGMSFGKTDQSTIALLLKSDQAITTSTLSMLVSEALKVKILSLNNIQPNLKNLSNGRYPLQKKMIMVHHKNLNELGHQFIQFVFSEQGIALLKQTGHVVPMPVFQ